MEYNHHSSHRISQLLIESIIDNFNSKIDQKQTIRITNLTKQRSVNYYQTITKTLLTDFNYQPQKLVVVSKLPLSCSKQSIQEISIIDKNEPKKQTTQKRLSLKNINTIKLKLQQYQHQLPIPLKQLKKPENDFDQLIDVRIMKNKRDHLFQQFNDQIPLIQTTKPLKPQKPLFTTNYDGSIINLKIKNSKYNTTSNKIKPNYSIKDLGRVLVNHLTSRNIQDDDSSSFDNQQFQNPHRMYNQLCNFSSTLIGRRTPRSKKQNVCFKTIIECAAQNMRNNSRKKIAVKTFTPKLSTERINGNIIDNKINKKLISSFQNGTVHKSKKCTYLDCSAFESTY